MAIRNDASTTKGLSSAASVFTGLMGQTWTLSCYVYFIAFPTTGNYHALFGMTQGGASNYDFLYLKNVGGNTHINVQVDNGGFTEVNGATNLALNTWYYLTITRESDTSLRAFINGVSEVVNTTNQTISTGATYIELGRFTFYSDVSNARFSRLKYWGAALTAAEQLQEMRTIRPQRFANLRGFYPIFPGTGERGRDYSGNTITLTEGGTLTDEDDPPISYGIPVSIFRRIFSGGSGPTTSFETINTVVTATQTLIQKASLIRANTITATQILSQKIIKAIANTVTGTQTLVNKPRSIISTLVTATQALGLKPRNILTNTVTVTQTLAEKISNVIAHTISTSQTLSTGIDKIIDQEVTGTQSLTQKAGSIIATTVTATQSLLNTARSIIATVVSHSDTIGKDISAAINNTITTTHTQINKAIFSLTNTVATITSVDSRQVFIMVIDTVVNTAQTLQNAARIVRENTVSTTDSIQQRLNMTITEVVIVTQNSIKTIRREIATIVSVVVTVGHQLVVIGEVIISGAINFIRRLQTYTRRDSRIQSFPRDSKTHTYTGED
jgi:hypothetical protein